MMMTTGYEWVIKPMRTRVNCLSSLASTTIRPMLKRMSRSENRI